MIDEVLRVLKVLELTNNPPRAHEILQELRDISSMAIEHFDEKICPLLKAAQTNNAPRENTFVLNRCMYSNVVCCQLPVFLSSLLKIYFYSFTFNISRGLRNTRS